MKKKAGGKRRPKPTQKNQFVGSKRQRKSKPDKKQLKAIYKLILTALPEARINQLIVAIHWFDSALDYAKDNEKKNIKLQTTSKVKLFESVEDIRVMSLQATNLSRKEELLKKLIEKYEQLFSGIIRVKSIKSVYSKLAKIKVRLEKRSKRLEAKYETVISFLEDGLNPKNAKGDSVSFRVGDLEKDRAVSSDLRSIMYSKQHAQAIATKYKRDGLLPVVVTELPYLAHICANKPNEQEKGKYILDTERVKTCQIEMLNNLISYCRSNSKVARRLIKVSRRRKSK